MKIKIFISKRYFVLLKLGLFTTILFGSFIFQNTTQAWTCGSALVDSRDDQSYSTVLIGAQCWMAQNINVGTKLLVASGPQGISCATAPAIQKYCYDDNDANCTTYGGLYQWNQTMCGLTTAGSQGICPIGWHVPTHDEFTTLERAVCTSASCVTDFPYNTSTSGWSGTNEGTKLQSGGSSGFNGLFAGSSFSIFFYNIGSYGFFWTSLQASSNAWGRSLLLGGTQVIRQTYNKSSGSSVRCLSDTKTITFNKNDGDTEANPTTRITNYNTTVTLPTAPTKTGYIFSGWNTIANGSGISFTESTAVTADITVYAQWTINTKILTYIAGSNGSITGSSPQTINYGTDGTAVTAVPNTGYHFVNWDDLSTSNPRTDINVTNNISVTANFAIDTKTITATAGANGTTTPSGITTLNYGDNQTYTIIPDYGYHVSDVLVNDISIGAVTTYTFSDVTTNNTIGAAFAVDEVFASPSSSRTSFSRRIQNLINQGNIQEANRLQQQFSNVTTLPIIQSEEQTTSDVPLFSNSTFKPRDLTINSEGNDVKTLQTTLNLMGYTISSEGPGSIGNETTMFGSFTKQALIKFQKENNITPAIGYFGPKTREVLIIKLIKLLVS